jgi:GTP-binding protein
MSLARVERVTPGSPAHRAGIWPGDELRSVNGNAVRDVIQYRLETEAAEVSLELLRGGLELTIEVVKDEGTPLGLEVSSAVFDQVRTCDNHCEFCFIYQLPPGMRPSLSVKDDDYRLSFLYGNFTTLTRFTEADLERVVAEGLSPLYVSIHATDPTVRSEMLRNRRGGVSLRWLRALLDHGVEVYGQIVVCPGVNDGEVLEETFVDLLDRYPDLAGVAVVPLGVSRYNREARMRPHSRQEAVAVVEQVEEWQPRFERWVGHPLVHAADEYYLLAGRPFPPAERYGGFPMHEDGVGMARAFEADFLGLHDGAPGRGVPLPPPCRTRPGHRAGPSQRAGGDPHRRLRGGGPGPPHRDDGSKRCSAAPGPEPVLRWDDLGDRTHGRIRHRGGAGPRARGSPVPPPRCLSLRRSFSRRHDSRAAPTTRRGDRHRRHGAPGGAGVPMSELPTVVIVGRPNVGKSTLLNRIVGRREAIVEERPGVTRDRKEVEANWRGRRFTLVDTGGWVPGGSALDQKVSAQSEAAVRGADVVLQVVDATVGITDDDAAVAAWVRRSGRPALLVANKVDDSNRELATWELLGLGLGDPIPVSALHGRGTGDLLDRVVELLGDVSEVAVEATRDEDLPEPPVVSVSIVGRPNVGKSTLFNRLLGEERSVVHDLPGTTRDSIDTVVQTDAGPVRFVDTAGMRRKSRIDEGTEYFSMVRALRSVDEADVALLVIDATEGVTHQDQRLAERIDAAGSPVVVVLNKWELLDADARAEVMYQVSTKLAFLGDASVLRISALTGRGVHRLLPALEGALAAYRRRLPTRRVNEVIRAAQQAQPGPHGVRVLYATQGATDPPTFTLFSNKDIPPQYLRYLERRLREEFGLGATAVKMRVRRRTG